jgi:hypothetical protein
VEEEVPVMTVEVLGMGLLVDPAVVAIMMVLAVPVQQDKVIMVEQVLQVQTLDQAEVAAPELLDKVDKLLKAVMVV